MRRRGSGKAEEAAGAAAEEGGEEEEVAPRDAKVIGAILRAMGVEEYEGAVVNQLLEFSHRYLKESLEDANDYRLHAAKPEIDLADARLAVEGRKQYSFTPMPPREMLIGMAKDRNSAPLPVVPSRHGVLLPPDRFCLTSENYQVVTDREEDGAGAAAAAVPGGAAMDAAPPDDGDGADDDDEGEEGEDEDEKMAD